MMIPVLGNPLLPPPSGQRPEVDSSVEIGTSSYSTEERIHLKEKGDGDGPNVNL